MPSVEMEEDYASSPRSRRLMSSQTSPSLSSVPSNEPNPAAEQLQDMIREKRATTQRTKKNFDPVTRLASGDNSELNETKSSPAPSLNPRVRPSMPGRRASGAGGKPTVKKEMGLREMSEHITKVDKQNFDLKLEVFHRRQRNDALEAKIQKLETNEADYEDLEARYTALLLSSDKERLVLEDAVAQIVELQAENEELQATLGGHFACIEDQEVGGHLTEQVTSVNGIPAVPATPPQVMRKASRASTKNRQNSDISANSGASGRGLLQIPARCKSYKSENGSHSLYSSGDSQHRPNSSVLSLTQDGSVFSGDEDMALDRQMLHSPRLSILSESGFSSIYGSPDENLPPTSHGDDEDSSSPPQSELESNHPQNSAQLDARIDLWIQDKPKTPRSGKKSPKTKTNQQYTSIEEVLSKRPVRQREEVNVPHVQIPPRQSSSVERAQIGQYRRERKSAPKSPSQKPRSHSSSNGSMVFGGNMPPTPDTMSTTTIGGASSSTQSIITEKSMLDHSGPPSKGYVNLVNYGRPQTSDGDSLYHEQHQNVSPFTGHHSPHDRNGFAFGEELNLKRSSENEDIQPTTERYSHEGSVALPRKGRSAGFEPVPTESHTRPALTSYQTDMMFNGDGFALVQPSRTISYPSPRPRHNVSTPQQHLNSPTKGRNQTSFDEKDVNAHLRSTGDAEDASDMVTPRVKDYPPKDKLARMKVMHPGEENGPPVSMMNQQNGETFRSRLGRFQFFNKRTNSQNAGNKPNMQATSPRRSRTVRSQSSTRAQQSSMKDRISSDSRPGTSDGATSTSIPRAMKPSNSRRHSAILNQAASFLPGASSSKDHSRRQSETHQVFKSEDSNSKWPLGRNASSKIKEGFGLMRSQAS